jgi:hypothetical protein
MYLDKSRKIRVSLKVFQFLFLKDKEIYLFPWESQISKSFFSEVPRNVKTSEK